MSRYAILMDNPIQQSGSYNKFKQPSQLNIFKKYSQNIQVEPKPPTINEENFPLFGGSLSNMPLKIKPVLYRTELTNNNNNIEEKEPATELLDGWKELRPKTIYNMNRMNGMNGMNGMNNTNKIVSETETYTGVFNSIVATNTKRTNEFIELNGYDTWHAMYQSNDDANDVDYYDDEDSEIYDSDYNIDDFE